jgi:hypothetical protein
MSSSLEQTPMSQAPMKSLSEPELRAFVGRNADYYFRKWSPTWESKADRYDQVAIGGLMVVQPKTGFNWAAFFLSGLWLPYRKMYRPTLIFFGVILAESLLEEIWFVELLGQTEPPHFLGRLVGLSAAVLCGSFGNRWYLSHARKVIGEVQAQGLPSDEHVRVLSRRGGTSLPISFGFCVGFFVVSVMLMIGLDLLFAAFE